MKVIDLTGAGQGTGPTPVALASFDIPLGGVAVVDMVAQGMDQNGNAVAVSYSGVFKAVRGTGRVGVLASQGALIAGDTPLIGAKITSAVGVDTVALYAVGPSGATIAWESSGTAMVCP